MVFARPNKPHLNGDTLLRPGDAWPINQVFTEISPVYIALNAPYTFLYDGTKGRLGGFRKIIRIMNVCTQTTKYEFTVIMQVRKGKWYICIPFRYSKYIDNFRTSTNLNLVLIPTWIATKESGSRGQTKKLDFIHFLESECLWRWIPSFSNNVNLADFSPLPFLEPGASYRLESSLSEIILRN